MMRKVASGMNYGVGKTTHKITMVGDSFKLDKVVNGKSTKSEFAIGGGEQPMNLEGTDMKGTPVWDNGAISLTTDKGLKLTCALEGDKMVVRFDINGAQAVQKFTRS